jgi:hypothetical protein
LTHLSEKSTSGRSQSRATARKARSRATPLMLALLATALLALSGSVAGASAADPTTSQYCDGVGSGGSSTPGDESCNVIGGDDSPVAGSGTSPGSGTDPAAPSGTSTLGGQVGTLPFTGWDLMSLVAIAAALIGGGIAISRFSAGRARS